MQVFHLCGTHDGVLTKYVDIEDFNETPPCPGEDAHSSKLDRFKPIIDKWHIEDKKAPRKQRHSARKVHNRLMDEAEGYNCSYRLTATYVDEKKKKLQLKHNVGYLPLQHHPSEAQPDFGVADFYENGKLHHEAKYLVLSFPYSNGGYLHLTYGENVECLLEGLTAMFEYIGGVPTEIWFDNTRTIVTNIIKGGGREVIKRFQRFCEHYHFKPVFMNPESGWETGNIENKVGYLRRNELVPVPCFETLSAKNKELLVACDRDMEREHYDDEKERHIYELFMEDKAVLLQLSPFRSSPLSIRPPERTNTASSHWMQGSTVIQPPLHSARKPCVCTSPSAEVIVMDSDLHEGAGTAD